MQLTKHKTPFNFFERQLHNLYLSCSSQKHLSEYHHMLVGINLCRRQTLRGKKVILPTVIGTSPVLHYYFSKVTCHKGLKIQSAAGLAQSVERLIAEQEVTGFIPEARPLLRVLK